MKRLIRALFFALLFSLSVSQSALAINYGLQEGERRDIATVTGVADELSFVVFEGRSYCCSIWSDESSMQLSFSDVTAPFSGTVSFSSRGRAAPHVGSGAAFSEEARRCFIWTPDPGTTNGFTTLSMPISTGASGSDPINNVSMRCRETTLFGGFNTIVTDFNFVEITNTLSNSLIDEGQVALTLIARSALSGEILTSVNLTIDAEQRRDISLHDVASEDFGPVTITHDGPPGALRAVNVQYRITNSDPLTFEPVLQVPFREGR